MLSLVLLKGQNTMDVFIYIAGRRERCLTISSQWAEREVGKVRKRSQICD